MTSRLQLQKLQAEAAALGINIAGRNGGYLANQIAALRAEQGKATEVVMQTLATELVGLAGDIQRNGRFINMMYPVAILTVAAVSTYLAGGPQKVCDYVMDLFFKRES